MKKLFLLVVATVFAVSASAQNWGVGVTAGYGTDLKYASVGAKVNWDIAEAFTVSPSFNYYFADKGLTVWDVNADLHWNVVSSESFKFYPLAGATYMNVKSDGFGSNGEFGINGGAGIQYNFSENFAVILEAKYQYIKEAGQFVPLAGIMYRF